MKFELEAGNFCWSIMTPVKTTLGPYRIRVTRGGPDSDADIVEKKLREYLLADFEHYGPISRAIREFAEQCETTKDSGVPADFQGNPI